MEVAADPFLAPNFTALAIGSALETTMSERVDLTWRATSRITVAGYGPIDVEDYGSGSDRPIGPSDFLRARATEALGSLMSNPWEPVTIESFETKVRVSYAREVMQIRGVQVLEPEVEPGQTAHLRITLQPYRGPTETKAVDLPIPADLEPQTLELQIQPGYEVPRLLPDPENVADLMSILPKARFDPESVVIQYRLAEAAATYRGRVANRLPLGAADTLRSTTQSAGPEVVAANRYVVVPMRSFVTGRDTARIKVRTVPR
jgi:hypothetical protein